MYFALHCIVSNIIPEAPSVIDKIRSIFVVQNTFTDVAILNESKKKYVLACV